jgi:hypothetical protein
MLKTTDGGATWAVEPLSIKLAANWIRAVAMSPTAAASPSDPRARVPHRRHEAPAAREDTCEGRGGRVMISNALVEAYLRFLLRRRMAVTAIIAVMTVFFAWQCTHSRCCRSFSTSTPGR